MFPWHRPLVLDDVETARAHLGDHVPLHPDAHGRQVCCQRQPQDQRPDLAV